MKDGLRQETMTRRWTGSNYFSTTFSAILLTPRGPMAEYSSYMLPLS